MVDSYFLRKRNAENVKIIKIEPCLRGSIEHQRFTTQHTVIYFAKFELVGVLKPTRLRNDF